MRLSVWRIPNCALSDSLWIVSTPTLRQSGYQWSHANGDSVWKDGC